MNRLFFAMLLLAFGTVVSTAQAQEAKAGDAKAGEKIAAMCMGCHSIPNYRAGYPEVYHVPKIYGQSAPYLVAALQEYKKGERKFRTMEGIAATLTDQQMADLAAYFADDATKPASEPPAKPAREPSTQVAELLKRGNCASCHGENFNTPISPTYPKLAGQYADYLYAALRSYKTKDSNVFGRNNGIMSAMAQPFNFTEMKALADYISSLPGNVQTVEESRWR